MIALLALIRKDVILFLNDKRALLLTIAMPIVLAAFFGSLTGGSGKGETTTIEIAVVMEDSHLISQKILAGLKAESALKITEMPLAQAQQMVSKGKLSVAVLLPSGFGAAAGAALFGAGNKPDVSLYYDPSQNAMLAMVKGMITQQVMQNVSNEMFAGKAGDEMVEQSLAQLQGLEQQNPEQVALGDFLGSLKKYQGQQKQAASTESGAVQATTMAGGLAMPFGTKEEPMIAKDAVESHYNAYSHAFAGMVVQFILFMAIDVGIGVLLARKLGLWNRLLAAPVGINTVITARVLSCALIAFLVIAVVFACAMLIFKVRILGSILGFAGVALAFSLMTASFGLLIAAFGKTPEAARGIAVFATLILVMLGGAWLPSFLFPQWLQNLTVFIPTRWAVDGFDAMTWRGLGIEAALPAIAALLAFTLIFGSVALWRFRAQQDEL